jgi:NTE family protein
VKAHIAPRRIRPKAPLNRHEVVCLTPRAGARPGRGRNALRPASLRRLAWRRPPPGRRLSTLNLALQGGGAHGAFTWGVLDRLLDEEHLQFEGISGTSAGALNAVVLASGWLAGGRSGAQEALEALWRQVAEAARLSPLRHGHLTRVALDLTAQLLSPYQLNPLGLNPLHDLLLRLVDFERLRATATPRLLLAATSVRTGTVRLFGNAELRPEVVLASACLPQVHHAVTIDGEPYWDGGFTSNPPLVPLVERCRARDVVLVQINPFDHPALPMSSAGIRNRVGEIVFGQPLRTELEQLAEARRRTSRLRALWDSGQRRQRRHRLHVIDGSSQLSGLDPATKIVPEWSTLLELRTLGRAAAASWLAAPGGGPAAVRAPRAEDANMRRSA